MPTNNQIARTDVAARIPEQVSNAILTSLQTESAVMRLFRRIPVSTNQTRLPILSALPVAYFVTGDTGLKQTTQAAWANKYINIEEIAAIVPIPEAVLADAGYDVWGTVQPLLEQAIARTLDAAVIFGVNKPGSWPAAIVPSAVAAGNVVDRGTNDVANGGIGGDLNDAMGLVESDGFDVNGIITNRTYRARLRGARDNTGQRLLDFSSRDAVEGIQLAYAMPGLWPTGEQAAEVVLGDFNQGILGVRQDITWKMLDQAVIQNADGTTAFNLAQQDMVAMRVTFRVGFQVANTINYDQPNANNRFPFAVIRSPEEA